MVSMEIWAHHDVRVIFSRNVDQGFRVTTLQATWFHLITSADVSRGFEGVIGVNHQCSDVCIPFPFFRSYPASTFTFPVTAHRQKEDVILTFLGCVSSTRMLMHVTQVCRCEQ